MTRPLRFNLARLGTFRSGLGATYLTRPCECEDCLECDLRAMRARVNGETPLDTRAREQKEADRRRLELLGAYS